MGNNSEKVTHRLAQRPASYEVLKYVRPVVKRRDSGELVTARMPSNVLERTSADVSLLAGMLVDKFSYHLPLHRQHRRMDDAGIAVSRSSLTNWTGRAIDLLKPVMDAQSAHVLESCVLAMDETPVKAGRVEPGKMRQAYFWPVYGEADEIVFHYAPTREHRHVEAFLGDFDGTLLSDGYEAYGAYAKRHGAVHALCRAHCRRVFEQAKESEPETAAAALALIGGLYGIERDIRRARVEGAAKRAIRESQSAPIAREFFTWCRQQCGRVDLPPARRGPVHVPRGRPAARRRASRVARSRTHAAGLEDAVRRRSAEVRRRPRSRSADPLKGLAANGPEWPLTGGSVVASYARSDMHRDVAADLMERYANLLGFVHPVA